MSENVAYRVEPRYEVIGGEVVMMAPARTNHNRVARNIGGLFYNFLRGRPCEYFPDGEGVFLKDGEEYQPDGMVVCDPDKVRTAGIYGAPDLVIEVLSPGTARYDEGHKKDTYERCGVREYWIANPKDYSVRQYVLENGRFVLRDACTLHTEAELAEMRDEEREKVRMEFPCAIFPELTVRLEDVFARVVQSA